MRRYSVLVSFCMVIVGCASATERTLVINGREARVKFAACSPALQYDGRNIVVKGLEVPKDSAVGAKLNFKVAEVDLSPKATRAISDYTQRYKMLIDETCKTMILLPDDARERYAVHRDKLVAQFIAYAGDLEDASGEEQVQETAEKAKKEADKLGSNPDKSAASSH